MASISQAGESTYFKLCQILPMPPKVGNNAHMHLFPTPPSLPINVSLLHFSELGVEKWHGYFHLHLPDCERKNNFLTIFLAMWLLYKLFIHNFTDSLPVVSHLQIHRSRFCSFVLELEL